MLTFDILTNFELVQTRTMENENFFDNYDAQGFEEILCDPPTLSNYDNDKIEKRPCR